MKTMTLFLVILLSWLCYAQELKINSLFSDNMVLQRDEEVFIYGAAEPDAEVLVTLNGNRFKGVADNNGNWKVSIGRNKVGGPFVVEIKSGDYTVALSNILFGDVWICSGQSNMNMPLAGWGRVVDYKEEIRNADYPEIRLLTIPLTLAPEPKETVNNKPWEVCGPETIGKFSSVAYFYARELFKQTGIPQGLVHVSKGGTPVETWMRSELLNDRDDLQKKISQVKRSNQKFYKKLKTNYKKDYKEWLTRLEAADPGLEQEWYSLSTDLSAWDKMKLPAAWEGTVGPFDGAIWFALDLDIPDDMSGSELTLELGPVQDYDITYFNGIKVGDQPKRNDLSVYTIPKELVKSGKNRIVVRVLDMYGPGGLWGVDDLFEIRSKNHSVQLKGEWFYKKAVELKSFMHKPPKRPNPDRYPTILFNGMISPLADVRAAGVIWYQGESNSRNAYQYREMFPRMIKDWRRHFSKPDMPFYFVQLANYNVGGSEKMRGVWPVLRESQSKALELPNTGMATAIDLGDPVDVHPKNKQEVGRRLALNALKNYYDQNLTHSGPVYETMVKRNGELLIRFKYVDEGLQLKTENKPLGFEIAGKDGKFYSADAKIVSEDEIRLKSDKVKKPEYIRYAWKNNPSINLYNSVGLPAYPFRTDTLKVKTQ